MVTVARSRTGIEPVATPPHTHPSRCQRRQAALAQRLQLLARSATQAQPGRLARTMARQRQPHRQRPATLVSCLQLQAMAVIPAMGLLLVFQHRNLVPESARLQATGRSQALTHTGRQKLLAMARRLTAMHTTMAMAMVMASCRTTVTPTAMVYRTHLQATGMLLMAALQAGLATVTRHIMAFHLAVAATAPTIMMTISKVAVSVMQARRLEVQLPVIALAAAMIAMVDGAVKMMMIVMVTVIMATLITSIAKRAHVSVIMMLDSIEMLRSVTAEVARPLHRCSKRHATIAMPIATMLIAVLDAAPAATAASALQPTPAPSLSLSQSQPVTKQRARHQKLLGWQVIMPHPVVCRSADHNSALWRRLRLHLWLAPSPPASQPLPMHQPMLPLGALVSASNAPEQLYCMRVATRSTAAAVTRRPKHLQLPLSGHVLAAAASVVIP